MTIDELREIARTNVEAYNKALQDEKNHHHWTHERIMDSCMLTLKNMGVRMDMDEQGFILVWCLK